MSSKYGFSLPLAALAFAACATTPLPETKLETKTEPLRASPVESISNASAGSAPGAPEGATPKELVKAAVSQAECIKFARELHQRSAEQGWTTLKGCVDRGHFSRGDFTDLRAVMNGEFDEELGQRNDALQMLTKIVALRGGDIEGDLAEIQKKRIPLFGLAAALKQPAAYKGKYVVVRARWDQSKAVADATTLKLVEQTLSATMSEAEVAGTRTGYSSQRSGSAKVSVQTSNYGSGSLQASGNSSSSGRNTMTRVQYDNEARPTGRTALAKLAAPDPFLEPGRAYVFLARFDGVKTSPTEDEEKPEEAAVISIVAYFQPGAMLVD